MGRIADFDTRMLSLAVVCGALEGRGEEQVNLVNATSIAQQRATPQWSSRPTRPCRGRWSSPPTGSTPVGPSCSSSVPLWVGNLTPLPTH